MRQLLIQVDRDRSDDVLELVQTHDGLNVIQTHTAQHNDNRDLIVAHLSNSKIESVLEGLKPIPDVQVTLVPHYVFPMKPPPSEYPPQLVDVTPRSPIEIWLGGLQSIGSWKSFLGYTVGAGIIVWIGLFTNTIYLLIAAMLLAPFASPAMNVAIATATGDWRLLYRSLLRYVVSLVVMIVTTFVLSFLFRQSSVTQSMISVSKMASMAVLLPLTAGAAGALNLVQSERSSLVSGSAVGLMIAASLAPPAGMMGMAAALGRWGMVQNGFFLLVLQLVAINLAGAFVFRAYGLRTEGSRYDPGERRVLAGSIAVTILLLAGLLSFQYISGPDLQRLSVEREMASGVRSALEQGDVVTPVELDVHFVDSDSQGDNRAVFEISVQPRDNIAVDERALRSHVTEEVRRYVQNNQQDIRPLVDTTILSSPPVMN